LARRDRDETFVALEMVTTTASACRRLFDETPTRSEGWQEPSEHLSVSSRGVVQKLGRALTATCTYAYAVLAPIIAHEDDFAVSARR